MPQMVINELILDRSNISSAPRSFPTELRFSYSCDYIQNYVLFLPAKIYSAYQQKKVEVQPCRDTTWGTESLYPIKIVEYGWTLRGPCT